MSYIVKIGEERSFRISEEEEGSPICLIQTNDILSIWTIPSARDPGSAEGASRTRSCSSASEAAFPSTKIIWSDYSRTANLSFASQGRSVRKIPDSPAGGTPGSKGNSLRGRVPVLLLLLDFVLCRSNFRALGSARHRRMGAKRRFVLDRNEMTGHSSRRACRTDRAVRADIFFSNIRLTNKSSAPRMGSKSNIQMSRLEIVEGNRPSREPLGGAKRQRRSVRTRL